jgi:hypothetical protein
MGKSLESYPLAPQILSQPPPHTWDTHKYPIFTLGFQFLLWDRRIMDYH